MLTYRLLEMNGDEYIYIYYPDGNEEAPGKVGILQKGNKRIKRILEESVHDFGKRYANHALNGIDISQKSGTVAWY